MRNVKNTQSGFSLIELMVVVGIIGILAAVAVPQFAKFQAKARTTEATALLGNIGTGEAAFFAQWTNYSSDVNNIGIQLGRGTNLRYDGGFPTGAVCTATAAGMPSETQFYASQTMTAAAVKAAFIYAKAPTLITGASDTCSATTFLAYAWGDPTNAPAAAGSAAKTCTGGTLLGGVAVAVAATKEDVWAISNSGGVAEACAGY